MGDLERKLEDSVRIRMLSNQVHLCLKKERSLHLVLDLRSVEGTLWELKFKRNLSQLSATSLWVVGQAKEMTSPSNL